MNTLWIKTLRDLWLFKSRTLLVVVAIAVGTAAVGVATTSYLVLQRDLRDGYRGTNPAHAILDVSPFDVSIAERVAELPGIAEANARRQTPARLVVDDTTSRPLQLWTLPDFELASVGRLYDQPGALSPPPPGTLLLERSVRPGLSIEQGDTVTVRLVNGKTAMLQVAGFVNDLAQAPTTVQPGVYGYISDGTAAQLDLPESYNQIALRVDAANPDRITVEAAVTQVTDWLEQEGLIVRRAAIPEPGVHLMQGSVDTGLLMIGILGGLTLILSAFLVTNVMSAVVAQQVPTIGVLKALGSGRGLIVRLYGRMVVIFGLMALALAVPLGLMGAYFQSSFLAGQLNYDIPSFGLGWQTLLIQAIGALAIPLLAALWPVYQASRLTIREALGGYGIADLSTRRGPVKMQHLPRMATLAMRNVARRKVRLALTLAALSMAGAMFIATFGLRLGLDEAIEILISEFPYDVQIDFVDSELAQRLEREAVAIEGVERAEAWGVADARRVYADGRTGSSFTLFGVPETTQISDFANRAGRWLAESDANGLYINYETEKLAYEPAVGEGLRIKINGSREHDLPLVGISLRPFEANAYMPYAAFEKVTGQRGRANRLVVYMSGDDPEQQALLAAELLARFEARGMPVLRAETAGSLRDSYRAQFNNLVLLLMALAGLTALVGGLGLANTMALNVLERSREIGILRSMGARRALLRGLVLSEGLAIGLISALFAVLLSLPLTAILDRVMGNTLLGSPLRFAFSPAAAAGWVGLVLLIAAIACWFPAERAARMTVREALAYE